jgi:hypothetical protein
MRLALLIALVAAAGGVGLLIGWTWGASPATSGFTTTSVFRHSPIGAEPI